MIESKLFENTSFPLLRTFIAISEQYKFIKTLSKNQLKHLSGFISVNKSKIIKMRDNEECKFIIKWLNLKKY